MNEEHEDSIFIPHACGREIESMMFNWIYGVELKFTDGTTMTIRQTDAHGGQLSLDMNGEALIERWNRHNLAG